MELSHLRSGVFLNALMYVEVHTVGCFLFCCSGGLHKADVHISEWSACSRATTSCEATTSTVSAFSVAGGVLFERYHEELLKIEQVAKKEPHTNMTKEAIFAADGTL